MFYGAAVGASAARYFASLSTVWYFDDNKLTSTNFSERERDRMREREHYGMLPKKFVLKESVGLARSFSARTGSEIPIDCGFILYLSALAKSPT